MVRAVGLSMGSTRVTRIASDANVDADVASDAFVDGDPSGESEQGARVVFRLAGCCHRLGRLWSSCVDVGRNDFVASRLGGGGIFKYAMWLILACCRLCVVEGITTGRHTSTVLVFCRV